MAKVICDHAGRSSTCDECPHAKPHNVHKPRQAKWDGKLRCGKPDWCDDVLSGAALVQCKPASLATDKG